MKSVRIGSYSGPYFPAFGLNTERYSIYLRIQSEYGRIRTRLAPNTDPFYAVEVCDELHLFTGVQQRVISAYHPQSNGLVERQSRTIKNSCDGTGRNPLKQPSIIEGVLFAHRVSKRASAKYFFFGLLYNREPVLPTDVK